jgi:hypothetical protein
MDKLLSKPISGQGLLLGDFLRRSRADELGAERLQLGAFFRRQHRIADTLVERDDLLALPATKRLGVLALGSSLSGFSFHPLDAGLLTFQALLNQLASQLPEFRRDVPEPRQNLSAILFLRRRRLRSQRPGGRAGAQEYYQSAISRLQR